MNASSKVFLVIECNFFRLNNVITVLDTFEDHIVLDYRIFKPKFLRRTILVAINTITDDKKSEAIIDALKKVLTKIKSVTIENISKKEEII